MTLLFAEPSRHYPVSGVLTWNTFSLAGGSASSLTVTVTAPATGVLTNRMGATSPTPDPVPGNNTSNAVSTVIEQADLQAIKTAATTVNAAGNLTYTLVIANLGPSSATSITVTDSIPATATFVSATDGITPVSGLLTWNTFSLASGSASTLTVTVTAPATGILTNRMGVTSPVNDPTPGNNTSNAVSTVIEQADLLTIKTAATTVNASANLTYTLVVTNLGPSTASSITVTDAIPATATFVSATDGITPVAGLLTWSTFSLASGSASSLTVIVTAPATGVLTNQMGASSPVNDPTPGNNTSNAVSTVVEQADLKAIKTAATTVNAIGNLTYTLVVTNLGPSTATSITVTDAVPPTATFVSATDSITPVSGVLTWNAFSLASGSASSLTVTVTAPATGILTNHKGVTSPVNDPTPGNNTSNAVSTVIEQADLRAIKTAAATVNAAANLTYTLVVTNAGPSTATSITVTDAIPSSVTFVSATDGITPVSGVLTWNTFSLASGSASSLTVTVTAPATGILTNHMGVTSPVNDPTPGNNTSNAASTVIEQADLQAIKTAATTVNAAGNLTYTLVITNLGPSAASSITVTDAIPASATFVSATDGITPVAGLLTWNTFSLASGSASSLTVTVTAPATGVLTNRMGVTSPVNDPTPGNNTSNAVSTVIEQADLLTIKTAATTVNAAANLTYTLVITNLGPSTASSITVTDAIPASATFVSATDGITPVSGVLTWNTFSLASGSASSLTVTVTAPPTGILTNRMGATSPINDPVPGNNTSNAVSTVVEQADLQAIKTAATTVNAAGNLTYTLVVTNLGPSTASSITVTDAIPASVTFVSATDGISPVAGVLTWNTFSLASGSASSLTVVVTAPATGVLTNHMGTTSPVNDPTPGNNTSNAVSTVIEQADLLTIKTAATTVNAAANLTYTLVVTNLGPSTASSITVTDAIPASVTFVSATDGITPVSGVLTWNTFSLASGSASSLTVTVTAPGTGILTNQMGASSPITDPVPGNNTSNAVSTVIDQADLMAIKTAATNVLAGANLTYTLVVTNFGPSTASSITVTDALPATATFVSATDGITPVGGLLTWNTFSLASGSSSSLTVIVTAPAGGILTNRMGTVSPINDPTPGNNSSNWVTVVNPVLLVNGNVYNDVNHNATRDNGETGTGLTLYIKAVTNGTVIATATVNSGTGAYTINVGLPGNYTLIVDDNTTLGDITPTIPAGWIGTEMSNQTRVAVVTSAGLSGQNFGLFNGGRLTGRVFIDTGVGGGTANNGTPDGSETGLPGVTVSLLNSAGTTTHDTTTTDGAGNYTLYAAASLGAVPLKVTAGTVSPYIAVSGNAGTTSGSYDRPTHTVTFNNVAGTSYSGINFGEVPATVLNTEHSLAGLPGAVVFFPHTFVAGTAGSVTFSTSHVTTNPATGWTQQILLDANCNSAADTGDSAVSGSISVVAGQTVCLLVKEFIPANAGVNAQDTITLRADFTYANVAPVFTNVLTRTDIVTVGDLTTAGLALTKTVDKATALPGEQLNYTILYRNNSSGPLNNIVIFDATPAFTTFISAGNGALPANLTGVSINTPGVGATGPIKWTFTGTLSSGQTGTVNFAVQVNQ